MWYTKKQIHRRKQSRAGINRQAEIVTPNENNKSDCPTYHEAGTSVNDFANHIAQYTGKTVTIFVAAGGVSGFGFTGILLDVSNIFVKLITRIGPAPECSLRSICLSQNRTCCISHLHNRAFSYSQGISGVYSFGSVAYISVEKISAFAHNLHSL